MLVFVSACTTKRKEILNKVDPAAYVARADYEGKTFHLVRSILDADTNNDYYAFPGVQHDFGLVTTRITDNEIQFISAFDPDNRTGTMALVAAYPITSHFDIVREENDYKEKTNRIIEERVKPWKQRAFMRVDWSRPTVQLSKLKTQLGDMRLEEEGITLLEAPSKDKNGNISWLTETSVKNPWSFVRKSQTFIPEGGEAAKSIRVTYRTHLLPVRKTDFQPVEYSVKDFSRFGFFTTEQKIDDPYRGLLDKNVKNYAELYNVCEPGTQRSCSTNKIVWHVNKGFPKEYLKATQTAVHAWNEAFQKSLGRTDTVVELDLKHQPDLADPTVNVIGLYDGNSPSIGILGLAVGLTDPRTGEKLSSRAMVYGSAIRKTVAWVDTMIDLLTETDPLTNVIGSPDMGLKSEMPDAFDLANLKVASENLRSALNIGSPSTHRSLHGSRALVQQLNASAPNASARRTAFFQSPRAATAMAIPELTALAEIAGGPLTTDSPLAKLEETGNPVYQGLDRVMQIGETIRAEKTQFLQKSGLGIHEAGMVEEAVERFLLRYYAKGNKAGLLANREKIKARVAELTFFTTVIHEMGHAFGLRHNFKASADQKHYHPNYQRVQARIDAGDKSFTKDDLEPFMYSSVMDYGMDFFAFAGSLGSYDVAAIRYAYNRSIDRENDPSTTKQNYFYCADHQVDETLLCQREDKGANVTQIVENKIDRYNRNYYLNHFRRGRANFEASARRFLKFTMQTTMIPVRRVMDEFYWMIALASENGDLSGTGTCGMKFMDASIRRGEMANVCDNKVAVNAAVDPEDLSTWFRALRKDKIKPVDYMPYGGADLIYANELAKQFFQSVLGTTEPGHYLLVPSDDGGSPTLKKIPGDGADLLVRTKSFGQSLGLDDSKLTSFMKEAPGLTVTIPMSEYAKPFYMSSSYEAGTRRLNSIGSVYDKIAAVIALSLRDIGISKFRDLKQAGSRGTLSGNPYVYPQTKSFISAVFGNLVVDDPSFLPVPVTFHGGKNAGKSVTVNLPATTNPDLQTIASIMSVTEMVFPFDQSMLSKLKICTVDEQGCLSRAGENGKAGLKFRSADYSTEYRSFQTVDEDSIAYALVAKAKRLDDIRRKLENEKTGESQSHDLVLRNMADAEPIRLRVYENLKKFPTLAEFAPVVGGDNVTSEWRKMQLLIERSDRFSPSAVAAVSIQIIDRLKNVRSRVEAKLAETTADDSTRRILTELSTDLNSAIELFDKSADHSFTGRDRKRSIAKISEKMSLLEANIRLIHSITKVLEN